MTKKLFEKIVTDKNLLDYRRKCRQEIREQVAGIRERLEAPGGITEHERDILRRGAVYLRWELRQLDGVLMALSLVRDASLSSTVEKYILDK